MTISLVRTRPTVVHAHDANTLVVGWISAQLMRAKLVYDAHEVSTSREGYQRWRRYVGMIEGCLTVRSDACITTTELRARYFSRAYGIARPIVIQNRPNFYDLQKTNRLRQKLGLSDGLPIVIYQGGLQAGRGLCSLIRAFASISNGYLVIIGAGPLESSLRQSVASLSLADRVFFLPPVPFYELALYTVSADIGVQPIQNTCFNHWSTDSNKLFEYVMAGLPVIASDLPEMRRVVKQYSLGLLFEPAEEWSLKQSLQELIDTPELRDSFRQNALRHREKLSWERQEIRLIKLYKDLLSDCDSEKNPYTA